MRLPVRLRVRILALVPGLALLVSSCSWQTYDRREEYLEAETIERVQIPDNLDQPPFEDALVIPNVLDPRQIAGQRVDIGLPETLSTRFGVDQIVIKRLEDNRWVFVDSPPAMVWPKVRAFFTDNGIPIESTSPANGEMITAWVIGDGEDAEAIFESIKQDSRLTRRGNTRHKFRVVLETGIRSGSTEIYVDHKTLPVGSMFREDAVEWDGRSDDDALEGKVLNDIAYYLGDNINTAPAFSAMASNVGGGSQQKAELVPDRERPILKYRLSFDRAWATVGNALDDASINIEDLDRNNAIYYVYYDDADVREPGFLRRLLGGGGDKALEPGAAHRYEVRLDNREDEVHVTVMKGEGALANAMIAEKLLKIIKQYST